MKVIGNCFGCVVLVACFAAFLCYSIASIQSGSVIQGLGFACVGLFLGWQFIPSLAFNLLQNYSSRLLLDRDYARIASAYSRTLVVLEKLRLGKSSLTPSMLVQVGLMKLYLAEYESAEQLFRDAFTACASIDQRFAGTLTIFRLNIGIALIAQDKYAEAESELQEAVRLLQKQTKPPTFYTAYTELALGSLKLHCGDPENLNAAQEHLKTARALLETMKAPYGVSATTIRQTTANCDLLSAYLFAAKSDSKQSHMYCQRFLTWVKNDPRFLTPLFLKSLNRIAAKHLEFEGHGDAEQLLETAYSLASECPTHPHSGTTLDCFERLLLLTNRPDEVEDMRRWLRADHELMVL